MLEFSGEERQAICDTFDRLLSDNANEEALRKLIETESGFDNSLWQKMAELGLTGLMVDPDYDGIGANIQEAEALMEVAGKYLYNGPFISSCVVAPALLQASSNLSMVGPHLKNIASGNSIFAIAGCGQTGDWTQAPTVNAIQNADGWELSGPAHFITHALTASHCLVIANEKGKRAAFLVDMNDCPVPAKYQSTDDRTLRLSNITFNGSLALRLEGVGEKQIDDALHLALIALAGEQVGGMRAMFKITIQYLNARFQFGEPIGRFQALKHMAADLLVDVESASTVARIAAQAMASGSGDSVLLTYLAAFTCADNFRKVTADAIQLHGGIAYTMEHPAHLYWRRAQTGQWLYASSDKFRDLYLIEMEAKL
jgi:alkylation response protein AidB-like acyl-CoA dehydrogenase